MNAIDCGEPPANRTQTHNMAMKQKWKSKCIFEMGEIYWQNRVLCLYEERESKYRHDQWHKLPQLFLQNDSSDKIEHSIPLKINLI